MKVNNLKIDAEETHIWHVFLLDFISSISYFSSCLSEDEVERANAFKFPADKKKFILGRGLLRYFLGKYLSINPQDIKIVYGLWGKPCLTEKNILYFNISHSGNHALYAFTKHYEVGVDLEYIDKNLILDDLAITIFSSEDLDYWKTLSQCEKTEKFFKYWVYKEAFLKAKGKGWLGGVPSLGLEEISLLRQDARFETPHNEVRYPYFFNCFSGHVSALYVEGPSLQIKFLSLPFIS